MAGQRRRRDRYRHGYRQDVDVLLGNPAKAESVLGWKRDISFSELVERMVKNDLALVEHELKCQNV